MAQPAFKMAQDGSTRTSIFRNSWVSLIIVPRNMLAYLIGHYGEAKMSQWIRCIQAKHSGQNVSVGIQARHSHEPQYHNRASGRVRHFRYLRYWPS